MPSFPPIDLNCHRPRFWPDDFVKLVTAVRARLQRKKSGGTRLPQVPPRMIQVPAAWFEVPFEKALKMSIRPPTSLLTRRKEITLRFVFPRVLFEDLMAPLSDTDVGCLRRTKGPNPELIPTKKTATTSWFTYLVRKGSVSDKSFDSTIATQPLWQGVGLAALAYV